MNDATEGQTTVPERREVSAGEATGAIARVAEVAARLLDSPWPPIEELLTAVRSALGAANVALTSEGPDGDIEVIASDGATTAVHPHAPVALAREALAGAPAPTMRLANTLGLDGSCFRVASLRPGSVTDLLIVGCDEGADASSDALRAIAGIIGAFRTSLQRRRLVVDEQVRKERTRWIQDIHDGVTQAVTAAVVRLETLRSQIGRDPRNAVDSIDSIQDDIRASLSDLREIIADVRPATAPAPKSLKVLIDDVVQRWRLPARLSVVGDVDGHPDAVVAAALLVVREALTNAAKHAAAKAVHVRIRSGRDGLHIDIRDNGRGFDIPPAAHRGAGTLGLYLMKLRVEELGGTIEVQSERDRGTSVLAFLPSFDGDGTGKGRRRRAGLR